MGPALAKTFREMRLKANYTAPLTRCELALARNKNPFFKRGNGRSVLSERV